MNACSEIIPIVFCRVYAQISIAGAHIWSKTQATFYVCTASSGARPLALWNIWQIFKLSFFLLQQNIWQNAIICNVRRNFLPAGNAVKSSQIIREKGSNLESRKYPNLGVESIKGTLRCSQLPCCISFMFFTLLWNTVDKYKDQNEPKNSAEEGN